MGLDDPTVKMSKSNPGVLHAINLLDSPDVIRRKIRRSKTDSGSAVDFTRPEPGIANLIEIYRCATDASMDESSAEFEGVGYGALKDRVAEALIEVLTPLQRRYSDFEKDVEGLESVLDGGAVLAREVAGSDREDRSCSDGPRIARGAWLSWYRSDVAIRRGLMPSSWPQSTHSTLNHRTVFSYSSKA